MQPQVIRTTAAGNSTAVILDYYGWDSVSLQAVVSGATYSVQVTLDNPMRPPAAGITWVDIPIPAMVGASTNQLAFLTSFVLGIRVVQAGAGSVTLTVIQPGRNT